ncbi:hypothetical protein CYA_2634 [Synechococcus sp. JA-3-3Ab]|nr:hypothetical protein CYA_2634 [Synechococcus sp. JA-3-3Ab]
MPGNFSGWVREWQGSHLPSSRRQRILRENIHKRFSI